MSIYYRRTVSEDRTIWTLYGNDGYYWFESFERDGFLGPFGSAQEARDWARRSGAVFVND